MTPGSVVVLAREAIESSHAENVADLLRQVPLLFIAQSGARGGLTTITLRGGKPNFTMVMFDGIPLNDITNILGGSFDFSTMSTAGVERIEIVRGPLSSRYGSDAVAGIINIIPRRGEGKASFDVGTEVGRYSTWAIEAATAAKIENVDYAVGGSYLDVGPQVEKDPYRLRTASLNSHYTRRDTWLRFLARYQESDTRGFPVGGGGPEFSILRDAQTVHGRELLSAVGWKRQMNRRWMSAIDFDVLDRMQRSDVPAIWDAVPPTFRSVPSLATDTDFSRLRLAFSNTLRLSPALSVEWEGGWRHERGTNRGMIAASIADNFELRRTTGHVNAELVYGTSRLTATAGLRTDKTNGFQAVASPRAGVNWRITPQGPRLKASWGRGFKMPSFYAVADQVVGNPKLHPEFSRSVDVGVEHDFFGGHLRTGLTVFRNSYTDLVDFSSAIFRLVNRSHARTQGVELEMTVPVDERLEVHGFASYLDWQLNDTAEPLRDVPRWRSGVGVNWKITRRWRSRLDSLLVGRRFNFQVPVPARQIVGGYFTTDVSADYEISDHFIGFMRVDNLFNSRFHEFIGFPNPGIYARVGVTLRFR